VQGVAERAGFVPAVRARLTPARAPVARRSRDGSRRIAGTTKMALQMGLALGAAFAVGRSLFGLHWTWTVLTAFIVCSGNRGREDVAHKAAMRLLGAGVGTLAATVVAGIFPAGDSWSIVTLFVVLGVAVWLRPLNYAFWAAGMTAALALLYGYYGEHGAGLLATRLEAIALGAAIGVASSWLLLPIRVTDVIRRDVGLALAALDGYVATLAASPASAGGDDERFRRAVLALEHHSQLLRAIPRRLRGRIDHLAAIVALERCAELVPDVTASLSTREPAPWWPDVLGRLHGQIVELRRANGRAELPDPQAWNGLVDRLAELPHVLLSPAAGSTTGSRASSAAGSSAAGGLAPVGGFRATSEKVLAYVNRIHGTDFSLGEVVAIDGPLLTYSVADPAGRSARLCWNREPGGTVASGTVGGGEEELVELAAGSTPSGYPYVLQLAAAAVSGGEAREPA
jgi:uncharacterized membrane protein YccC